MSIIVKLQCGLGNQMFQYAFAKATALRNNVDFKLDISEYERYFRPYELEIFEIEKKYASKEEIPRYERRKPHNYVLAGGWRCMIKCFWKQLNMYHYSENSFAFTPALTNIVNGYVDGFFQTEKYFKDYEKEIKSDFTFHLPPTGENKKLLEKIRTTNSVSIHIRRGDYLQGKNPQYHGNLSLQWYKQAINLIKGKVNNPIFFFFSDDMERVKQHFNNDIYINNNQNKNSWEDMRLMSECKHNIIANSSFSRRGAWLNANPEKIIIAPKLWTISNENNDIIPQPRIKI